MTPDEARDEVLNLYTPTSTLIGGTWNKALVEWDECTDSAGKSGVFFNFYAQRRAQPLDDPDAVAEQARALWAERGHAVKVVADDSLTPPRRILSDPAWMSGSSPDGLLLQLTIGTDYADFTGTSRCVPGDLDDLNTP
jgi:hypothetical protein